MKPSLHLTMHLIYKIRKNTIVKVICRLIRLKTKYMIIKEREIVKEQ